MDVLLRRLSPTNAQSRSTIPDRHVEPNSGFLRVAEELKLPENMVSSGNDDVVGSSGDGKDRIPSVHIPNTAHSISTDSWYQVAFILTSGVNSAYVLGYPGTVMVPLGWIGGAIGLILATLASLHANEILAKIHEHGGKRHIRYRDLAGYIYGKSAYYITWTMQYVNLYLINVGFVILAGNSLKVVYHLYREDDLMKLAHFIVIAGLAGAVFAISIPHLSALRVWLVISTLLSLIYIIIGCVLSIQDGIHTPPRDYSIPGQNRDKIFSMIGAAANIVFSFNTGMLPEIQATVRQPVLKNTMKALYFQFTAGVVPMYAVIFSGYWAYGNLTSEYLFNNTHGKVWMKTVANVSAFFQSIISLHIFASPMYEYLDTKFETTGNLTFRVVVRGSYIAITTFISAILPFLGDFMSLTGALCTYPLTFILAHHMYIKAKGNKLSHRQKLWHWTNVGFFSLLACAAFVAAIREIHKDSSTFHLFADL